MWWIILSLASGLGDALLYAYMKKLRSLDSTLVVWAQYAFSLPFVVALLIFFFPDAVGSGVYWIAAINSVLLAYTMYLLFKGFGSNNLSLTVPLLSFTPLFLLITSYVMVHEIPTSLGYVGIFLIVLGTYIININPEKKGILGPFKALLTNRGARYTLMAAFLMSIMANMFKIGITASNPFFYSALVHAMITFLLLPLMLYRNGNVRTQLKENFSGLFLAGFFSAFMQITAGIAVMLTIVPYMISLKRSSVLFGLILGAYMFNEHIQKRAMLGTFLMFTGAALIVLS
jgi:drug/metabolite transporter (DMT)-like permease